MTPLVTLAIPAYLRADLLARTLRSAFAQQDLAPGALEVLVVEDPAADESGDAPSAVALLCRGVDDPRFRYERNPYNLGMVGNWNRCLREARGRWVVILHDDDWLEPDFVRQCLDLIEANPALRLVGCTGLIEREGETPRPNTGLTGPRRPWRITPFHFLMGNPFLVSGVMMDRQMALDFGGFDDVNYPTMDSDFWLRFCETAPAARLPEPLVHYFIGRNASMKESMLTAYIVNDFRQRRLILDTHFPGNRWLRWYSRLKPYRQRRFLEGEFRMPLPATNVEHALVEAGWRPVTAVLRWIYLPLRLVVELVSLLTSRRLTPRARA